MLQQVTKIENTKEETIGYEGARSAEQQNYHFGFTQHKHRHKPNTDK